MHFVKSILKKFNYNPTILCVISSVLLVIVIEAFHNKSIVGAVEFIGNNPIGFLINVMILMSMMILSLIARRRLFWSFLVGLIWLMLGVANYFVLCNRVSPLSWADVGVLSSVLSIIRQYLSTTQIVLVVIALVFCILLSIFLYRKVPPIQRRQHWLRDVITFVVIVGSTAGLIFWADRSDAVFERTGNITLTFQKSGFVYSFSNSIFDSGIQRPFEYSEAQIANVKNTLKNYDAGKLDETTKAPNIIFVQLESIFDMNNMRGYSYSEDPMPNFHALIRDYSSGLLTVPTLGAGTVNTEFEILTGMSMDYFGLCEYPFKTILQEKACESMAYNLQERGYYTTAMHNNKGTFYSRHKVYSYLGFDRYNSIEFMDEAEYNPIEWAKDTILADEAKERMLDTQGKDFMYLVTVQAHGKYPTTQIDDTQTITIQGEGDDARRAGFEYYVNQCKEVDDFIGRLIDNVESTGEDTVIVFYGDHLPTLDITDEELQFQNTYQTTYVIWDNIGLERKDENLNAYQLSSAVMAKLGYGNGVLTRYHQMYRNAVNYEKYLEMLQYDMLYGEQYIYGGVDLYSKSGLKFGLYDLTMDSVRQGEGVVVVHGANFTHASTVFINGKKQETVRVGDHALLVKGYVLEPGDRVRVRQVTSSGGVIHSTKEIIYKTDMFE